MKNLISEVWYCSENDVIGGWCITNYEGPASAQDFREHRWVLADFINEQQARHIVELHNKWLKQPEGALTN